MNMQAPSRGVLSTRSVESLRLHLMAREHAAAVAARIAEGRAAKGLTQRTLAEAVNELTGRQYDGAAVSRWETGRVQPEDDTLRALEGLLSVDLSGFYATAKAETPDAIAALKPNGGGLPAEQVELLLRIEALLTATLKTCVPNLDYEKLERTVQGDVQETLGDRLRRRRTG
jgi:transcriptional regulator with XRE-family HTH domain